MVLSVELKKTELTGLNTGMGPPRNRTGKVTEHCEAGEEVGPREMLQAEASYPRTSQLEFLEKERHQRKSEDCVRQCGIGVCKAVCHVG